MAKKNPMTSLQSRTQKLSVLDGTNAYRELRQDVVNAGILDRAYNFYTLLTVFAFAGFFFCIYELYVSASFQTLLFWGLIFAIFGVQIGGLMHDASHRAIGKTTKVNNFLGRIYSSFIIISFGNWLLRHNAHHANPNMDGEDPDVDIPLLSFSKERYLSKTGIQKTLRKYQAYLFFPMLSLGTLAQRIGDLTFLLKQKFSKKYYMETIIFLVGFFLWFILPFFIFSFAKAIELFLIVNLTTGFYMANIFAPNHKGMPQIKKGTKISFMEQQIMTSRNINANPITDFLYIGLNYQIEHHLFPNCPRNKLKLITPYLHQFCKKLQLEYTSVSVIESNKIILGELNRIAKTAE